MAMYFYDNRCSICQNARVAELADAQDLKSCCSDTVPVRFRSRAVEEINSILVNIQGLSFFITWEISHTIKSTSCDNAQFAEKKIAEWHCSRAEQKHQRGDTI